MGYVPTLAYSPNGIRPYPYSVLANGIADSLNELAELEDDWIAQTLAISAGGSLGNGTLAGRTLKTQGREATYGSFTLGSTSSISGNLRITGVGGLYAYLQTGKRPADILFIDTSANAYRFGAGYLHNSGYLEITSDGAQLSGSVPFTWATGDKILWRLDGLSSGSAQEVR